MKMAMMNLMEGARVDAKDMPMSSELTQRIGSDSVLLGIKDPKSRARAGYGGSWTARQHHDRRHVRARPHAEDQS